VVQTAVDVRRTDVNQRLGAQRTGGADNDSHCQRRALPRSAGQDAFIGLREFHARQDTPRKRSPTPLIQREREPLVSTGQRHARDLTADRDEAILQRRIVGLRIRLPTLQMIEVFPGHL
jgi:hypothetical protein